MRFRTRSANEIAADALRMAERKEAQGCSPCAETYRELARDPSRRRLIGRALLGAGGLATASLVDVGGVLAGSSPAVNGDSGAAELPELDAARLGSRLAITRRSHRWPGFSSSAASTAAATRRSP